MEVMTKTVLCAIDGSLHDQEAIRLSVAIAAGMDAKLNLLAVDHVNFDGRSAPVHELGHQKVQELLTKSRDIAIEAGCPDPRMTAVAGRDIARAILNYAEEQHVDHIVLGTGEKMFVERLLIGSVSHDVVLGAHCGVSVAR
ncbi:MAG: universal stress protein [Sediminimonas qiaohouensis]|uniref:Universal stress protein n=2 Tax=Sediminimonas qiaohouensis TaxID=552061 RepID=A0A7C9LC54_9RHOB|nr:universal stress protein [Sediminimonas qiaohouensis]